MRDALGNADVVVHVEPVAAEGGLRERATAAAAAVPEVREVHNVRVMRVGDAYELSLHVKLPRDLSLAEAHDVIERLEAAVDAAVPELQSVHTHIEPLSRTDWASDPPDETTAHERAAVEDTVRGITGSLPASPCASATPSAAASRSSRSRCPASSRSRPRTTTRGGSRRRCASAARGWRT